MLTKFKDFKKNFSRNFNLEESPIYKGLHNHLLDPKHSVKHRFRAGTVIMCTGVAVVKASMLIDMWLIHFIADVIGYGIHGIGLIVFAHLVENPSEEEEPSKGGGDKKENGTD